MKHPCVPSTMTPESLAVWIKDNADEVIEHIEKIELEEEQVHELEKKSSLASRAIDRLEEIKKNFMDLLKEGTPNPDEPVDVTIPPTSGLKILKANRAFADRQLEQGFKEEVTQLYVIPYPEDSMMVAVDIEGREWPEKSKEMSGVQMNNFKPMLKKEKKTKTKKVEDFIDDDDDTATAVLDL
jgi:DNA-binding transcriptional regulator of glucitol operon